MKVALLVCDHVSDDLVPIHGDYPMMFRALLPELAMDTWFVCDGKFPDINDYDAFICTGSKYSVYEDIEWITDLAQVIRDVYNSGKKFFGSCFGHQMMAHALGGVVRKSDHGYLIGVHSFQLSEQPHWVGQNNPSFNILMLCQDQVTELPAESKVWASSEVCPIGMYTVGSHFLGIQGHPEYTKEFNQAVFESRPEKISQTRVIEARATFDQPVQTQDLAFIILSFIRDTHKN